MDQVVRDPGRDDETIGILVGARRNRAAVQIALQGNNHPLAVSTYATLPPGVRALLPSEEDLSRVAQDVIGGDPLS